MNNTINTMLTDFAKIALNIKATEEKLEEKNFIARLVICYEEKDKNNDNYKAIKEYTEELNKLNFTYKAKANKYFYLLHKKEFNNIEEFNKIQSLFMNSKGKILTINTKNFVNCKDFLVKALAILKANREEKIEE